MSKRRGREQGWRARPRRTVAFERELRHVLVFSKAALVRTMQTWRQIQGQESQTSLSPFCCPFAQPPHSVRPPFAGWIAASASLRTSDVMLHISVAVKVVPLPFYRRTEKGKAKLRLLSVAAASGAAAVTASNRGWTESVLSALLLPSESQ